MDLHHWLEAAGNIPPIAPSARAAHPQGTPERAAADRRSRREWLRHSGAREAERQRTLLRLRAWLRVHPRDEHARDLLRVWATYTPAWMPRAPDVPQWRSERDAILSGLAAGYGAYHSPRAAGEW